MKKKTKFFISKGKENRIKGEYLQLEHLVLNVLDEKGVTHKNEEHLREALHEIGEILGINDFVFKKVFVPGDYLGTIEPIIGYPKTISTFHSPLLVQNIDSLGQGTVILAIEDGGREFEISLERFRTIVHSCDYFAHHQKMC